MAQALQVKSITISKQNMYFFYTVLLLILCSNELQAQFINGYAKVTTISGLTLTLSNVDEASDTFENGESIILMQMQGNVLGNTTNTVNFGDIGSIGSTGRYEICRIASITESSGVPITITLQANTRFTYSTDANSSLQIITFPNLGTPNYTTTGNLQAKNWNGNVGGVIAFEVTETLTLAHNISANGTGFRGGARSIDYYPGGTTCDGSYYITTTNHTNNGAKGEGIYRSTNINYDYARGKILNGGGGGNALINAGGGGGGNLTAGGDGGRGWNSGTGCSPSAGGLAGISLLANIGGSRIFMGGGGGGGQQNNSQASNGANGGGIILIKARTIRTTGTCGITISANGNTANNGGNDGQGGGGAGGSIVFQVDFWNVVGTCPLTVTANGGNGGNVVAAVHGGGGGGGQGTVIYSIAIPNNNITTFTNAGVGGCNDTGCSSRANGGTTPNGLGIFGNINTIMPMQVKYFTATLAEQNVSLNWEFVAYTPILRFELQKTLDGVSWRTFATMEASPQKLAYHFLDTEFFLGTVYYRLKQVGLQNEITYSNIVSVNRLLEAEKINIYPNPTLREAFIDLPTSQQTSIKLFNQMGQVVPIRFTQTGKKIDIDLQNCASGIYFVQISNHQFNIMKKIVVQ